ncbi:MAG: ribonuclease J [Bacillota bacterium]|nr:ribonuclease J [Bacillota bacterium]
MQNPLFQRTEVGIFALGGLGEVGKNMYCVEYGDDLIIIDSGLLFSDEYLMGIDYVIPDYTYLIENQEKIRGLFLTHGHEDHIGGIPFLLKQVRIPAIYASGLAVGLIKKKLEEHRGVNAKIIEYVESSVFRFAFMEIGFFRTNHSIPDSFGITIKTPSGTIVHTGDFKFDFTPTFLDANYQKMARIGEQGVLCLLSDSTNAELEDFTASERVVAQTIHDLFKKIEGRVIISTFASNVHRIQQIVDASVQTNRKVAVFGRSMESTIEVGIEMKYIKAPEGTFIFGRSMSSINRRGLTILCTGSQGEPLSALTRIASGSHKQISLIPGDTVVLSASPIPGNQESVNKTINLLYKNGATVITQSPFADVHASGHGGQNELKLMLKLMKPKFFMPIHGEYRMLMKHAELGFECGVPKANIFIMDNGDVLAVSPEGAHIAGKVHAADVYVDGAAIGEIGSQVIKDRRELSEDGLLSVVMTINQDRKEVICVPTVISKGFIFMKDNDQMVKKLQELALDVTDRYLAVGKKINIGGMKSDLVKTLGKYLQDKTNRMPMIMPVIMVL